MKAPSGSSSAVERQLPKLDVAGSIPVSRSIFAPSQTRRFPPQKMSRRIASSRVGLATKCVACLRAPLWYWRYWLLVVTLAWGAHSQAAGQTLPAGARGVLITVTDENNVVVPLARVSLQNVGTKTNFSGETDPAGHLLLRTLPAGTYRVHIEKAGFYAFDQATVTLGASDTLEIAIHHQQEVGESVTVVDAVPGIDPQQTVKSDTLNSREITNIPYPSTRDVRNVLPFIPGVVQDNGGGIHVAGAPQTETLDLIDGFNITDPASGIFLLRISPEAVRSIDVESTRYPAQFGSVGGVISLETRTGDDRFRISAVNFIPTFQTKRGFDVNNWTPRVTFGGPIIRGRAWFYLAHESEYDLTIVKELPPGADRSYLWRTSDLAKVQVNVSPGNVLSVQILGNLLVSPRFGIDAFDPISISRREDNSAYMVSVRDQITIARGTLLEIGGAFLQFNNSEIPQGTAPEVLQPGGNSGNFYREAHSRSRRGQFLVNLFLPSLNWFGRHDFRAGIDLDRDSFDQSFHRHTILARRVDGSLAREINFTPNVSYRRNSVETGAYVLDRWAIGERLLVEPGLRFDWDEIFRRLLFSPRLAATLMVTPDTKLSFGAGWFYNPTLLELISRPLAGARFDQFFNPDGTPAGPVATTTFAADLKHLQPPDALNWSVGLQQKLPGGVIGSFEFLERLGQHDFAYDNPAGNAATAGGVFHLNSARRNRYDGGQITLRRDFANHHAVLASYTRSRAFTNEALGLSIDSLIFARQSRGPLSWDAPNRIVSWGFLPLPHFFKWHFSKWDLAYSMEWRSGFPFNVFDDQQELAGPPNRQRFPDFFTLNPALERRFNFHHYLWAIRVGMDNITDRQNPTFVDNNINSPTFLTFSGFHGRTFNGRIRFLGKEAGH
jgi:hypothetical protein